MSLTQPQIFEQQYFLQEIRQTDKMLWALSQENLSSGAKFANNTGADQPAHARSPISAFGIRLLESIISRLATSEISIF